MYDKDKIEDECIEIIKREKLTFFSDLVEFIEPTLSTLYEWESEKSEAIKKELAKNKIATKRKMRNKWVESDNATLQISAYKLMADEIELGALTMNKVDHSGKIDLQQITGMQLDETEVQTEEPKAG